MKLLKYSHTKGNVDFYIINPDLNAELYIESLNIKTGEVSEKRVLWYTYHKDLRMFKVSDPEHNRFEPFWVSDDHSMIIFDGKEYLKLSPLDIINNNMDLENNYLVKVKDNEKIFIKLSEINIKYDPDITEAADLTVEDNYTFATIDGIIVQDTMSVFMPLTEEGQREAKEKLLVTNNIVSDADGGIEIKLSAEYILGLYYLTQFEASKIIQYDFGEMIPKFEDVKNIWKDKLEYEAGVTVKYNDKYITVGRLLITSLFYEITGIELKPITVTKKIYNTLCKEILQTGNENYMKFTNELIKLAATQMTIYGKSFELKDFVLPPDLEKEREKLKLITDTAEYTKKSDELFQKFVKYLSKEGAWTIDMIASGAKSKANQFKQITIGKGVVMDPMGRTLEKPIADNLSEGLTSTEFFDAASGARKGMIDRSQNTAVTGYLTRKMVYATSSATLSDLEDCGTTKYLDINVTDLKLAESLTDRYIVENGKLLLIGKDVQPSELVNKIIHLRSPMYCKGKTGICKTCYGTLYKIHKSKNIGIIAAQSIGERNTQLAMQTFHTGGATTVAYNENFLSELSVYEPRILDVLYQDKDKLFTKSPITIMFKDYKDKLIEDSITTNTFYIVWDSDHIEYMESNSMLTFTLTNNYIAAEDSLSMSFDKGKQFAKVEASSSDVVDAAKYVVQLLERTAGKNLSGNQLLFKLYNIYSKISALKLVHFEVILSNLMRDPDDIYKPYRLSDFSKPEVIVGIKKVPKIDSWLKAAMFEGFKQSLEIGLVTSYVNLDDPLVKISLM